ncbi:MAG TPA: alpha-amylase domain-containing protein [Balneolaceae bacterium]
MLKWYMKCLLSLLLITFLVQCEGTVNNLPEKAGGESVKTAKKAATNSSGVMMQGFYWDVPDGGIWWNTIKDKADELADMAGGYGIERIWLPPPSKAMSGGYSMGYDPADYYDLGNYYQYGTTETRFGSKAELKSAISTLNGYGISVMGDIVLNHRSGGDLEYNPATGTETYTDFSNVKSGKATWHWDTFHPNHDDESDPGYFGGMPDVCYSTGIAYDDMKVWMNWLQNDIGFNGGWRFDYVKGLETWAVKDMITATGNPFSIGEYWDSNTSTLDWWVNQTGASVFDFALYYTMADIFNQTDGGGYLPNMIDPSKSFAAKRPMKAVTFAGNHDTDEIVHDKMLAYAFMLTYQGYPSIWWKDYFNYGLSDLGGKWGNGINQLVWVRGQLASGAPAIELLKTNSGDLLIYGSYGTSSSSPGYIVVINDHPTDWKGSWVQTDNSYLHNKTLKVYAWWSSVSGQNIQPDNEYSDASGWVEVWAPPRGYAVYSVTGL